MNISVRVVRQYITSGHLFCIEPFGLSMNMNFWRKFLLMKKVWVIKELNYHFSMSPFLRSNFSQSVSRTVRDFLRKPLEEQRLLASVCLSFLLPVLCVCALGKSCPFKARGCTMCNNYSCKCLLLTDVLGLPALLITSFHKPLISVSYLFFFNLIHKTNHHWVTLALDVPLIVETEAWCLSTQLGWGKWWDAGQVGELASVKFARPVSWELCPRSLNGAETSGWNF